MRHILLLILFVLAPTWAFPQDKAPLPDSAAVREAEGLVKEVFQEEFAKADTPSQKVDLAEKLLKQGIETM